MASLTLRESVAALTAPKLADLRSAIAGMQALSDNRGFNFMAGIHGVPQGLCWHHYQLYINQRQLPYPLFLPWHRAYLYTFEQHMKDNVATAALHWWDWRTDDPAKAAVPAAYADPADANGNPNPLLKSHIFVPSAKPPLDVDTQRFPGTSPSSALPSTADVDELMTRSDLFDFNDRCEQLHDDVHVWTGGVGGDMGSIDTAAYDPIFWAHHCMIDRLWWLWQVKFGPENGIPPSMMSAPLAPFPMKVSDVIHIETLGYEYAGTSSEVTA